MTSPHPPDEPARDPSDGLAAPVVCTACGTTAPEPPVTWSSQVSERGRTWLCERCTRDNVRSIEGKLDEAWW